MEIQGTPYAVDNQNRLPGMQGQQTLPCGLSHHTLTGFYRLARGFFPGPDSQFTHPFAGDSNVRMYSMTDSDQPSMCVHLP